MSALEEMLECIVNCDAARAGTRQRAAELFWRVRWARLYGLSF